MHNAYRQYPMTDVLGFD